jgi:Uma2 family endonuclease
LANGQGVLEMTDTRESTVKAPLYDEEGRKIPPAGKISYEEFLDWADEDDHAEWVDGEIIMPSPANYRHQKLEAWLENVIGTFSKIYDLGETVVTLQMKLPDGRPGREPDVLFIAKNNLANLRATYLNGPADLVIEIISPESENRDRQTKFAEYEAGGVREYWLFDPRHRKADFYQLSSNGQFQAVSPDSQDVYHSAVLPGFWLNVNWFWQNPLPEPEDVLMEVAGEAYARYLIERLQRRNLLPPNN